MVWYMFPISLRMQFLVLRLPLPSTSFIYWWTPQTIIHKDWIIWVICSCLRCFKVPVMFFCKLKYGSLIQMNNLGAGKTLPTYQWVTVCIMSWLTKLSNVSSNRGQYHGKYTDERIWDGAQSSAVMAISTF